ncbi:MAG: ribonuclease PH [Limnochordia bacterium]|jgi:ribonuclease PH
MTKRIDGRAADELRPFRIVPGYTKYAEGSVLVEAGDTRVLCTVSFEDRVPYWLRGTGQGWITAEYGMLPRATCTRNQREASRGKQGGRTLEIQRLIGRSLRAVADIHKLADYTVWVDCDVIQADGGTRTASVTGAFVALALALDKLTLQKGWDKLPLGDFVAGISVGLLDGVPLLDLCYEEDSAAVVDMNVIMTGSGRFVEVQGTGEGGPFTQSELASMLDLATGGAQRLIRLQKEALGETITSKIGGGIPARNRPGVTK